MINKNDKIQALIDERIFGAAKGIKKRLPKSISDGSGFYVNFGNESLHVIAFLKSSERVPLEERIKKGYDPFPGLITTRADVGAAFRIDRSKNCFIKSCEVNDSYSLSVGKDSSIILVDHKQKTSTYEMGVVEFSIDLSFILSFPEDLVLFNLVESFEDLISYYYRKIRSE